MRTTAFAVAVALALARANGAQNLIVNGDMSDEAKFALECRTDGGKTGALSLHSEDLTWNKCGRLEVVATEKSKVGSDVVNANAWIGRNDAGRLPGFFVKPNATYSFSIDLRGTPRRVRVAARTWSEDDIWRGAATRLTTVSMTKIGEGWATYSGTFKTGPKDVRAALCVQMWSDTQYPKADQYKVGDWVMFDNVSVYDRQGDIEGFAKKYGRPLAVAPVPVTADMRVPFVPEEVQSPPERIAVKAAVNELKAVPLALANLTGELAEYRVSLESTGPEDAITKYDGAFGLYGFPSSQITMRKGVRFKDSDQYQGKLRIDPLVAMDEASTIAVPAMECGLVWVDIDTSGVRPGRYEGRLRVISLSETGKTKRAPGGGYDDIVFECPGMVDVPFSLEVMPIALDREPPARGGLSSGACDQAMFRQMTALGCREFMLSPWAFAFDRADDGSFDAAKYIPQRWDGGDARSVLRDYVHWAEADRVDLVVRIAYSAWHAFNSMYGTPGDMTKTLDDWKLWLKAVKAFMNANGIGEEGYQVQIQDEPKRAAIPEILETMKAAHEAVPEMQFSITFLGGAAPLTVEELRPFEPYLGVYTFHDNKFLRNAGYHDYIEELLRKGKTVTHYTCSTRMTEDLDREFRQNAWMGERWGLKGNCIYHGIDAQGGAGATNWKTAMYGGLIYRAGDRYVPSVRGMALRQGVQDVKYLAVLRRVAGGSEEVDGFLREAAVRVTDNPAGGDRGIPDRMREKAAELILKYSSGNNAGKATR